MLHGSVRKQAGGLENTFISWCGINRRQWGCWTIDPFQTMLSAQCTIQYNSLCIYNFTLLQILNSRFCIVSKCGRFTLLLSLAVGLSLFLIFLPPSMPVCPHLHQFIYLHTFVICPSKFSLFLLAWLIVLLACLSVFPFFLLSISACLKARPSLPPEWARSTLTHYLITARK